MRFKWRLLFWINFVDFVNKITHLFGNYLIPKNVIDQINLQLVLSIWRSYTIIILINNAVQNTWFINLKLVVRHWGSPLDKMSRLHIDFRFCLCFALTTPWLNVRLLDQIMKGILKMITLAAVLLKSGFDFFDDFIFNLSRWHFLEVIV